MRRGARSGKSGETYRTYFFAFSLRCSFYQHRPVSLYHLHVDPFLASNDAGAAETKTKRTPRDDSASLLMSTVLGLPEQGCASPGVVYQRLSMISYTTRRS